MKFDLNEVRKHAGLPPVEVLVEKKAEKEDASPEHKSNEKAMFEKACECCANIVKMCDARLAEKDLSAEHKKQYTELRKCCQGCCDLMTAHLKSYKD